jgi:hypothetical protein
VGRIIHVNGCFFDELPTDERGLLFFETTRTTFLGYTGRWWAWRRQGGVTRRFYCKETDCSNWLLSSSFGPAAFGGAKPSSDNTSLTLDKHFSSELYNGSERRAINWQ